MKVIEVTHPTFRTGESNGKVWVLSKVKVEGGKEATGFGLNVGDEVELEYSEKYKSWSAKKVTAQSKEKAEIMQKLDRILEILEAGSQGRGGASIVFESGSPQATNEGQNPAPPASSEQDLPPLSNYEEGSPF